ncbi:unnamed protein product, partial [Meganyctiphanes norvegica]
MFLNPWYGSAQGGGPGALGVGPPSLEGVGTQDLDSLETVDVQDDSLQPQQQTYFNRASPLPPLKQATQGRASPAPSCHSEIVHHGRASPLHGRGSPLGRCSSPVVRQGSPLGVRIGGGGGSGGGGRGSPLLVPPLVSGAQAAVAPAALESINARLRLGWTAHTTPQGRIYYC